MDGKEAAIMNIEALVCNYQSLLQATIRSWNRYTESDYQELARCPWQGGRGLSIKRQEPEIPCSDCPLMTRWWSSVLPLIFPGPLDPYCKRARARASDSVLHEEAPALRLVRQARLFPGPQLRSRIFLTASANCNRLVTKHLTRCNRSITLTSHVQQNVVERKEDDEGRAASKISGILR
jgi:hypothetical protein